MEDAEDVVRRLVAVRVETSLAGVELDALLGVWPECLLVDDAGAPHRLFFPPSLDVVSSKVPTSSRRLPSLFS